MISVTKLLLDSLIGIEDSNLAKITIGPHWTVVVTEDRKCGMASTEPSDPHCPQGEQEAREFDSSSLIGQSTLKIAQKSLELDAENSVMRTIAIACLNALLPVPKGVEKNARELMVEQCRGKKVAMIGHFPFAKKIKEVAAELWILELHPKEGDFPASMTPELVPKADVVAMTASTIINGTIDGILEVCSQDSWVMIMGQSTPMSPVLARAGINALAGAVIDDSEALLKSVAVRGSECQEGLQGLRKVLIEM